MPFVRYTKPFLKWTRVKIRERIKKFDDYAHSRNDIDCMCQEKKGKEELTVMKMALLHQYKNSRTKQSKNLAIKVKIVKETNKRKKTNEETEMCGHCKVFHTVSSVHTEQMYVFEG